MNSIRRYPTRSMTGAMVPATLQLTVIERGTGRQIGQFASQLDTTCVTSRLVFEEEAWRRAVRACLVAEAERSRYSVELSIVPRYGLA